MKYTQFFIGFIMLVLLASCEEYASVYPAGDVEDSYFKKEALGEWTYVIGMGSKDNFNPHTLEILNLNNKEYLLRYIPDTLESADDINLAVGHITKIDGHEYASVRSPREDFNAKSKEKYVVHRFLIRNDSLFFWGMSDDTFEKLRGKIKSTEDHWNFIEQSKDKHWDLSYLYVR